MAGLLALVHYYDEKHKSPFSCRQDVVEFYLGHLGHVDNWDLVDLSAPKLAGRWLNETLLLDKTSISNWEAAMNESNELWLPQWRIEEMNFPPWYVRLLTALEFWEIRVSLVLLLALKASHPLLVFLVCRWHLHRLSKDGDGEGGGYIIKGEPFDDPDLIHKAIGWVLREVGKGKEQNLVKFLSKFAHAMPRTTVSYSTERLSASERKEIKAKCK
jgi:3-methyladenine DNA glycosylase AlkD